jgi:hypothetical protein
LGDEEIGDVGLVGTPRSARDGESGVGVELAGRGVEVPLAVPARLEFHEFHRDCTPGCGGTRTWTTRNATPYPDIAAPLATAPVRGENATSYPNLAAPLGTAPVVTPPATAPATTQPAATSTPAPLSSDAEMLDEGTSEILSCMGQGGQACEDVVLLLDEWGGVIPTIGETPAVRADGVAAHGLALQMFGAETPAQVSALAPQFLGAINHLRADLGLAPLPG